MGWSLVAVLRLPQLLRVPLVRQAAYFWLRISSLLYYDVRSYLVRASRPSKVEK